MFCMCCPIRITDEGSVPEMRIWSILLIKSDRLKMVYTSSKFLYIRSSAVAECGMCLLGALIGSPIPKKCIATINKLAAVFFGIHFVCIIGICRSAYWSSRILLEICQLHSLLLCPIAQQKWLSPGNSFQDGKIPRRIFPYEQIGLLGHGYHDGNRRTDRHRSKLSPCAAVSQATQKHGIAESLVSWSPPIWNFLSGPRERVTLIALYDRLTSHATIFQLYIWRYIDV